MSSGKGAVMSDVLKGNYPLDVKTPTAAEPAREATLEERFEASALERLGGSTAFVKKSSNFVWRGEESK